MIEIAETVWLVHNGLLHMAFVHEDGTAETNCTVETNLPRFRAKYCEPKAYQNVKLCNKCLSYEAEICDN